MLNVVKYFNIKIKSNKTEKINLRNIEPFLTHIEDLSKPDKKTI